jgi:hypothetical protein
MGHSGLLARPRPRVLAGPDDVNGAKSP